MEDKDLIVNDSNEEQTEIEDISDVVLEETVETLGAAHDDFDWSIGKRNIVKYEKSEQDKYFDEYDNTLNSIAELEVV